MERATRAISASWHATRVLRRVRMRPPFTLRSSWWIWVSAFVTTGSIGPFSRAASYLYRGLVW